MILDFGGFALAVTTDELSDEANDVIVKYEAYNALSAIFSRPYSPCCSPTGVDEKGVEKVLTSNVLLEKKDATHARFTPDGQWADGYGHGADPIPFTLPMGNALRDTSLTSTETNIKECGYGDEVMRAVKENTNPNPRDPRLQPARRAPILCRIPREVVVAAFVALKEDLAKQLFYYFGLISMIAIEGYNKFGSMATINQAYLLFGGGYRLYAHFADALVHMYTGYYTALMADDDYVPGKIKVNVEEAENENKEVWVSYLDESTSTSTDFRAKLEIHEDGYMRSESQSARNSQRWRSSLFTMETEN